MCEAEGITREHAPPLSFFPEDRRINLVVVPSCHQHNTKNSKDVEYVRNAIVSLEGGNSHAEEMFLKAERSFSRSPKLFSQTFREFKTGIVRDREMGSFPLDLVRLKEVMKAILFAIYFKDHDKRYSGDWRIFCSSLGTMQSVYHNQSDGWDRLRESLRTITYTEMPVSEPEVFKYAIHKLDEERLAYKFEFYESFIVNAWSLSTSKK